MIHFLMLLTSVVAKAATKCWSCAELRLCPLPPPAREEEEEVFIAAQEYLVSHHTNDCFLSRVCQASETVSGTLHTSSQCHDSALFKVARLAWAPEISNPFFPAFQASGLKFPVNCRVQWEGGELDMRVKNNKFRAPFDQKCFFVKTYHNMTDSMTLSKDTDGTTETDNTW